MEIGVGAYMKFMFENLGLLDEAEIELADLTVICGENNTGKTYATYAIYGFLRSWRSLLKNYISREIKSHLKTQGNFSFDLQEMFAGKINEYLAKVGEGYVTQLDKVFATKAGEFSNSVFFATIDETIKISDVEYQHTIQSGPNGKVLATINKKIHSNILEVLVSDNELLQIPFGGLSEFVSDSIAEIVFSSHLPRSHIASAERTGATIFRKELDFARTRMVEALGTMSTNDLRNPFQLIAKMDAGYAWPVRDNVDFVRQLEDIDKQVSDLSQTNPDILAAFDTVIGGTYKVIKDTGLVFESKGKKRFSMNESSSCIRALLDIGFYLRCKAQAGDLFIIDEPELNLHPKNQRAFARLIARLVNAGIKVFITTHSDYLVKEFNTLIMLNQKTAHTRAVQKNHGYDDAELLDPIRVRLYMTGTKLKAASEKRKRATRINTLLPAKIYPDRGIEVSTFDDTIDTMNDIQSEILYGGEL